MKRLLLLLCFGLLCSLAGIAPVSNTLTIEIAPVYRPYEKIWRAVCQVESGNDPYAIGDKKLKKKSYGIAQIRETRLDDYYEKTGIRYTKNEMFDTTKSKSVFLYYAMRYSPNDTESISRSWNGGERGMKKHSTRAYYKKVKKYLELSN